MIRLLCSAIACSIISCAVMILVVRSSYAHEFDLYGKAESFRWEEFSDHRTSLLEESGILIGVGGGAKWGIGSMTLKVRAELFGGSIEYDGQTWGGDPVSTDQDYFGMMVSGDMGYRHALTGNAYLEPFLGLGFRKWDRGDNALKDGVQFYKEEWTILYGRIGARGDYYVHDRLRLFGEAGMKLPLYNENRVDMFDITIEPGKETSFVLEAGCVWKRIRVALYYENLRFSESDSVRSDVLGSLVYQPESKGDMWGIQVGYAFGEPLRMKL